MTERERLRSWCRRWLQEATIPRIHHEFLFNMSSSILRPLVPSRTDDQAQSDWLFLAGQRLWQFNRGFFVALLSGSLGMLLAFWLLLSQLGMWLLTPRPVARPVAQHLLNRASPLELTLGQPPLDRRGPRFSVNLHVQERSPRLPPQSPGLPAMVPLAMRSPLQPEFAPEPMAAPIFAEVAPVVSRFERKILVPEDDCPPIEQPPEPPAETTPEPELVVDWAEEELVEPEPTVVVTAEPELEDPLEPEFGELAEVPEPPEVALLPEFADVSSLPLSPPPALGEWLPARPRLVEKSRITETAEATTRVFASPAPMTSPARITIPAVAENPVASPKCDLPLSLQWYTAGKATAGRLHRLVLVVRNGGSVPLSGVTLLTQLPEAVWHARGDDLEMALEPLAAGEAREIPLWIRPRTDEPVVLRTRAVARCGRVETAGVLQVEPRALAAARGAVTAAAPTAPARSVGSQATVQVER